MHVPQLITKAVCLTLLLAPAALRAESKNPADYPLRLHILNRNETTFYHRRYADEAKGEGRADLFENSMAHGVDFTFDCDQKIKDSFGYETYPAKWKKPGQELVVLLPVFGKSNTYFTCSFKTDVKNFAYTRHNGKIGEESVDQYKAWMVKHEYDPEHGKDMPVKVDPADAPPPPPPPPSTPRD